MHHMIYSRVSAGILLYYHVSSNLNIVHTYNRRSVFAKSAVIKRAKMNVMKLAEVTKDIARVLAQDLGMLEVECRQNQSEALAYAENFRACCICSPYLVQIQESSKKRFVCLFVQVLCVSMMKNAQGLTLALILLYVLDDLRSRHGL
jgi:hypothetical protein